MSYDTPLILLCWVVLIFVAYNAIGISVAMTHNFLMQFNSYRAWLDKADS